MPETPSKLTHLRQRLAGWQNQRRITRLAQQVAAHSQPRPGLQPVVFFNASTRLTGLSQNAAFQLLAAWALRLLGVPVVQFVSQAGMSRCVLGTNRDDHTVPPPCTACVAQSRRLYTAADVRWFTYAEDPDLAAALHGLSIAQLGAFEHAFPSRPSLPHASINPHAPTNPMQSSIPLGRLVLPSIRWALRRHDLSDDEPTRFLLCAYILSAYHVAREFAALVQQVQPSAAVIFNGIMYPEAAARWVAGQVGLQTITHEVSFQRFSAFFTHGEATAYPLDIPDDFDLSPEQNARLDGYLEQRFQGQFTMAGIRFWPEMRGLDEAFLHKAAQYRQIVPVFTNVIFDTSQVHANAVFPHMFAWLDLVLELIRSHPDTLFIIRAHPDEMRPGTAKQSRQSVRGWILRNQVDALPNVVFIDSQEYISSYELIQRAKFVIVYNSSIGLEASLMGRAVLCGGKARYTQYPTVFFPETIPAFQAQAEAFLAAEQAQIPGEFQRNARRFLYHQLFRASLPFDEFIQASPRPGFVELKTFSWQDLLPERSPVMGVLTEGILHGKPFLVE